MTNINDDKNIDRRRFITLAGVGGVGAVTLALPGQWTKPIFDLVAIPAHAQETTNYLTDIFKRTTGPIDDGSESNDLEDQENESIEETESDADGGSDETTSPPDTTSGTTTSPPTTDPGTTSPPTTDPGTTEPPTTEPGHDVHAGFVDHVDNLLADDVDDVHTDNVNDVHADDVDHYAPPTSTTEPPTSPPPSSPPPTSPEPTTTLV